MLTEARLKELLDYSPDTGVFTWKSPTSRRVGVGSIAGTKHSQGYILIRLDGAPFFAHRLAVLYQSGKLPDEVVDHVNGDRSDNRWCNLRVCSRSQNQQNRKVGSNSHTGVLGVYVHTQTHRFIAQITARGAVKHLGCFGTLEEARAARNAAAIELHKEFARMA